MRAWIGCLSCYNSGALNGAWISAERAYEELHLMHTVEGLVHVIGGMAQVDESKSSPVCRICGSDEFDVMDTEGLPSKPGSWYSFYENAERLMDLAESDEIDQVFAVMKNFHYGLDQIEEAIRYNADNFRGECGSLEEFAQQLIDDCWDEGGAEFLGRPLKDWIDPEAVWRWIQYDYWTEETERGWMVWENR